jgi:hypothetical protein
VAYAAVTLAAPQETFWSPDNGGKLIQLQNLRWQSGLDRAIVYPGRDLDPQLEFVPFYARYYVVQQGQVFLPWSLAFPLLSAPLYALWGYPGLHLLPLLCGVGALAVVLWLCWRMPWPWPLPAVLLVALGTPLAIYSAEFWEHTPAVFLALLAAGALVGWREARRWGLLIASGVLLSLAALLRLELYLAFPAGALALALAPATPQRRFRPALVFLGIGLLGLLLTLALYAVSTGWILPASFSAPLPPLSYLKEAGWAALADFSVGSTWDLGILAPLPWKLAFAVAALLAIGLAFLPWERWRTVLLALAYGAALATAAVILLRYPDQRAIHGALIVSPVLLLAWVSLAKKDWGDRASFVGLFGALYLAGYAVAGSQWGDYNGGLEWGPRYALLVYPLLVPAALQGLRYLLHAYRGKVWRWVYLGLFLGLAALSVTVQARGVASFLRERQISAERQVFLEEFCPQDVVTDLWWLPSDMAAQFYERRFFLLTRQHGLALWLARAARSGDSSFCLVRAQPVPAAELAALAPAAEVTVQRVGQAGYLAFMVVHVRW